MAFAIFRWQSLFTVRRMETFFEITRWIHIAAGFTGFFIVPVALLTVHCQLFIDSLH